MPRLSEATILAFRDELRKEALDLGGLVSRATPALKNVGALGGVGALAGGVVGAGAGAVHSYRQARQQGAGVGDAALGGLSGALGGAGKGALIGGLAGAAGGAGALAMGRDLSGLTATRGAVGAFARSGQRQVHALTGMLSPQELEGIRGGVYDARKGLTAATEALDRAPLSQAAGARRAVGSAQKAFDTSAAATGHVDPSMDLTSLPGYVRSVRQHGVGKVLGTGLKEQVSNMHPAMAAAMIGLPAVGLAKTVAGSDAPDDQGRGKFERAGEDAGRAVGGIAGGVMPLVGQSIVGGTLGRAGRLAGRGIDKLRGLSGKPGAGPANLDPTETGQHIPTERVTSPAAAGQQADIGL